MTINLFQDKGIPLEKQRFTWKELAGKPISKLDDDAFTRIRVIWMNGQETDALRTKQVALRSHREARATLSHLMRVEEHQSTAVNWLIGTDHSPLETTIAYEQVAIEVTASIAQLEQDPYLAQGYRLALLEDFDHLYRYAAMLDRLEGKDANNITQGYTDIIPGRPTLVHHRAPEHELLRPYERDASLATKVHALALVAGEYQTHDYYHHVGPLYSDPLARQLYAEIKSVEAQHITHYGCMLNPDESLLEKLLICEANEAWNYAACAEQESNPRIKAMWERFLDYELGHMQVVMQLFKDIERRDPAEVIGEGDLPEGIQYQSHRDFMRKLVEVEVPLRKDGTEFVDESREPRSSREYRQHINAGGSPSEIVSATYSWTAGTELARAAEELSA